MTSWAKVASVKSPERDEKTNSKPVAEILKTNRPARADLDSSVSVKFANSSLVAVPRIPARHKNTATAPSGASTLITGVVNPQQKPSLNTSSTLSEPAYSQIDNSLEAAEISPPTQISWEYDVYAAPFVPSEWRTFNLRMPVQTILTQSRHVINYSAYISTFAGTSFLLEQCATTKKSDQRVDEVADLAASSYKAYFDALLYLECGAQELENEGHALYKVPLYRMGVPSQEALWGLTIPGLREDSPFLEMGDTLQLRQLWVDNRGSITNAPMLVNGSEHQIGYPVYPQGWTGVQYDACVYSVNRAREAVYLKVKGLGPLYTDYELIPMAVNVTLPLKHTKLLIQQQALENIATELHKADLVSMHIESGSDYEGDFDDFDDMNKSRSLSAKASEQKKSVVHNDWTRRILFPKEADGTMQTRLRDIPHRDLFDHAINYEQAHAINSVCTRDYGTLPYLISGPPGTGKTKTLVEMAMQLYNTSQAMHTLICAPSEAAADTLALRLKRYLSKEQLFRLIRPGRADNEVPQELTQYCYMNNDMFSLPPIEKMMLYNIVVTSCQDAGILLKARLTNNDLWHLERKMLATFRPEEELSLPLLHWGALLVDEAAQATEIDLLAAVSVICPPSAYPISLPQPLFVMAGDENQLGPKTASRDPRFSTSLFARLADRPLYKDHPLSRSSVKPTAAPPVLKKSMLPIIYPSFTNLTRNYRSHPAILSIPSALFYNDTLIPEAVTPHTPLQSSALWRGRNWPVLFIPNPKPDEIERDGGGWYNLAEAQIACSIAQQLVMECDVKQKDICIMSPFAAQVKLLRSIIRSRQFGLWEVNIGPLEAFQGLEKRVVIICTTRTRERFLAEDAKRGLGIVHQKRKMNVALTRAKEALFVIGNPAILMQDEHWRQWLAFCWRNRLVENRDAVWKGDEDTFGEEKIGVLERALVAKESLGNEGTKVLGAATKTLDMDREYEIWMESLREALDEESEDEHDEDDDDDDDDAGVEIDN
jgi:helicase MOV-10